MLTQEKIPFTVDSFNSMSLNMQTNNSMHHELNKDWRAFIASRFTLTENQAAFFANLPRKSVLTIQRAMMSVARGDGGMFYLQQDAVTQSIDVVCNGVAIFKPQVRPIVICRFDGFFKKCKWFPKDQTHQQR